MSRSSTVVSFAVLLTTSVVAAGTVGATASSDPDDGSAEALEQFVSLGEGYGYRLIDPACSLSPTEGTAHTYTCYAVTELGDPFIVRTSVSGIEVVEFDIIARPGQPVNPVAEGGVAETGEERVAFDALRYFAALFSGDPAEIATLQPSTAPGSPAEAYAMYQIEFVQTQAENAERTLSPVNVYLAPEGVRICVEPDSCVHATGLQVVDGQLVTFSVEGLSITPRLGRTSSVIPIGTSTAQLRAAYRSVTGGRLVVFVEFTSTEQVIFELSTAVYVDADGNQTPIDRQNSLGATDVDLKGTATAALAFPDVDPGGEVRFLVYPGDGSAPLAAVLPVDSFTAPAPE